MPNPRYVYKRWPNIPLDEHLKGATHIRILCRARLAMGGYCTHQSIMMTADLYAVAPGAVTCSEFHRRLRCKRCGAKGWVSIEAAGR